MSDYQRVVSPANLITLAGLGCGLAAGCLSVAGLSRGVPLTPAAARLGCAGVAAWAVLDGADGPVARRTTGPTWFGACLDSKTDLVCGGTAAPVLAYAAVLCRAGWLALACAAWVAAAAWRLARFDASPRDPRWFTGLPVPAAAVTLAALSAAQIPHAALAGATLGLAGLMASTVPFPATAALAALRPGAAR